LALALGELAVEEYELEDGTSHVENAVEEEEEDDA
jgi:hypothetical protein